MEHSDSIANLATALSQAQAEMPSVPFDATNAFLKNRYASLGAMIETARPVLAAHGLSVSQIVVSYEGQIGVETVLMHTSGEWISNTAILPAGEEKGKSTAQVAGSLITYLRRYSYAAILGLYADEDTDGNAPQQNAKQGTQKPPQGNEKNEQPARKQSSKWPPRPWDPQTLKAAITASVENKPVDQVSEDKARKLAIVWRNITGQKDDMRHAAVSFIAGRNINSFLELSDAMTDALSEWLKKNPPLAREEAQELVMLVEDRMRRQESLFENEAA
jgi:hypothetical protein